MSTNTGTKERHPEITTDDIVDQVAEWIAFNWTQGQMKNALEISLDRPISTDMMKTLIGLARKEIHRRHNLPIEELRNNAYEFYAAMIRSKTTAAKTKINARTRLDILFGLEVAPQDNPNELADKIRKAMEEAGAAIEGPPEEELETPDLGDLSGVKLEGVKVKDEERGS